MIDVNASSGLKGYLLKWTNYIKGYQKRWFVLQNGLLSYYRNQAEVAHTCRGTINLANAKIVSSGATTFVISNSSTQTFHLRASNEIEQKKWVAALLMGKAKALALGKSDDDSDEFVDFGDDSDVPWTSSRLMSEDGTRLVEQALSTFENRISDLQHYQDTLRRKEEDLQLSISELEAVENPSDAIEKLANVKDRGTVYKVASMAMVNSCSDFLGFTRTQASRWRCIFQSQLERRARLEQMVEELAKQIRQLENQARQKTIQPGGWAAIPGQAVPIDRASFVGARPRTGTLRAGATTTTSVSIPSSQQQPPNQTKPSSDGEEEDDAYFDVEDSKCSFEFDVTLPTSDKPTTALAPTTTTTNASSTARLGDHDAGATSAAGGSLFPASTSAVSMPIGADLAMEYESDIADSDGDEDYGDEEAVGGGEETFGTAKQAHRKKQTKQEVRVIQKHGWGKASYCDSVSGGHCDVGGPATASSATSFADASNGGGGKIIPVRSPIKRRTSIPPKPNISLNLWSILSNCIGKELTKIPMPVNFSEPLSMLQRLSENFEYSYVLDRAATCSDPVEQLAYVSAFVVSSYASTALRVNKPFNPLLNETYECDRTDDLGWRSVSEQVSHHPPVAAFHCESDLWYTWFDFSISTKFRGRYLQIKVNGVCHLVFRKTGHHYTWTKIPLTVHNIIVGRLWIDNSGEIDITNHTTGDKCHLTFKPYSYFSSDIPRRVTGAVSDKSGKVHGIINGTWDEFIEYATVESNTPPESGSSKAVLVTGQPVQLWRVSPLQAEAEKMYNFTQFAIQLNDSPVLEANLCPTDCRLRPDQRLMEDGRWDEANAEKARLEDKQRFRRRQMALELVASGSEEVETAANATLPTSVMDTLDEMHKPLWFEKVIDEDTGLETLKFTGKYWECKSKNDWSMCPDLY